MLYLQQGNFTVTRGTDNISEKGGSASASLFLNLRFNYQDLGNQKITEYNYCRHSRQVAGSINPGLLSVKVTLAAVVVREARRSREFFSPFL